MTDRTPWLDLDARLDYAIQCFWEARERQQRRQVERGTIDAGSRGAVTGGTQMDALEALLADLLGEAGIPRLDVRARTALALPGYYRPEKKWDLVAVSEGRLVAAIELKSQVGPSFGNNFNNRAEEAIGSATDLWVAYREGRFGTAPTPFLGYFFLLEDCPAVKTRVRNYEPYFHVDPAFRETSYCQRYEILCRRLVRERLYSAACLVLATKAIAGSQAQVTQPAEDISFARFATALRGHALTFL